MIEKCCICGRPVVTKYRLPFRDLLGAGTEEYIQHVGLCRACGYVFTQNPFTPEQLENRYKNLSKYEYDSADFILPFPYKAQCARQKHFLEENLDLAQVGSVFEVGASSGYNLSLYRNEEKRVFGVEPSERNCRLCREHYGFDLFCGMFDEYLHSGDRETYDLVFLSEVLEHIVDPMSFLRSCDERCERYMFIEVPTLDLRFVDEPMGIFVEEHVSLFTLDSLNEMMSRLGYALVNAESFYGIGEYIPAGNPVIDTLWEKRENLPPRARYNLFSAEELLEQYIAVSERGLRRLRDRIGEIPKGTRLALWGVGHHIAMLLANTELMHRNIVRVYDSDVRKQGFPIAGVEVRPFDRGDVDKGLVDGILLTTYTAQKAILKDVEAMNLPCEIYTLYDI